MCEQIIGVKTLRQRKALLNFVNTEVVSISGVDCGFPNLSFISKISCPVMLLIVFSRPGKLFLFFATLLIESRESFSKLGGGGCLAIASMLANK